MLGEQTLLVVQGDDLPVLEDGNPLTELLGLFQIMVVKITVCPSPL